MAALGALSLLGCEKKNESAMQPSTEDSRGIFMWAQAEAYAT